MFQLVPWRKTTQKNVQSMPSDSRTSLFD